MHQHAKEISMPFDLSTLAASDTSVLHLKDADDNLLYADGPAGGDGKPTQLPVTVTVYGPGSKEHARASTAQSNKQLKRLRKKGDVVLVADDVAEDGADFLTAITASFENLAYKGEPVTTREQIRAVYLDRQIGFIGDQINEHVKSWSNFTKGSASS
jgi:hypothetical protein